MPSCRVCNQPFPPSRRRKLYCSPTCRRRAERQREAEAYANTWPSMIKARCIHCASAFTYESKGGRRRRFCSKQCGLKVPASRPTTALCRRCGVVFRTNQSGRPRLYCSSACTAYVRRGRARPGISLGVHGKVKCGCRDVPGTPAHERMRRRMRRMRVREYVAQTLLAGYCRQCGSPMVGTPSAMGQQQFCSAPCSQSAQRVYGCKCTHCGIQFRSPNGHPAIHCSKQCKLQAMVQRQAKRALAKQIARSAPRACVECGQPFSPHHKGQIICSTKCSLHRGQRVRAEKLGWPVPKQRTKACGICGKPFISGRSTKKFCDKACTKRAFKARQRERLADTYVKKIISRRGLLPRSNIPPEIVAAERSILRIKRLIKDKTP